MIQCPRLFGEQAVGVGAFSAVTGDTIGDFAGILAGFLVGYMGFYEEDLGDTGEIEIVV